MPGPCGLYLPSPVDIPRRRSGHCRAQKQHAGRRERNPRPRGILRLAGETQLLGLYRRCRRSRLPMKTLDPPLSARSLWPSLQCHFYAVAERLKSSLTWPDFDGFIPCSFNLSETLLALQESNPLDCVADKDCECVEVITQDSRLCLVVDNLEANALGHCPSDVADARKYLGCLTLIIASRELLGEGDISQTP